MKNLYAPDLEKKWKKLANNNFLFRYSTWSVVKGLQFRGGSNDFREGIARERGAIFHYVRGLSIVIIRQPARELLAESGGSSR